MMDIDSALMIVKLVAKGIGVVDELRKLALRIQAGEKITEAEVEEYLKKNAEALEKWDAQKSS